MNQFESMVKEEVKIDPRVHSMIIGKRGRTIHKIMDDFKVESFIFIIFCFWNPAFVYFIKCSFITFENRPTVPDYIFKQK